MPIKLCSTSRHWKLSSSASLDSICFNIFNVVHSSLRCTTCLEVQERGGTGITGKEQFSEDRPPAGVSVQADSGSLQAGFLGMK